MSELLAIKGSVLGVLTEMAAAEKIDRLHRLDECPHVTMIAGCRSEEGVRVTVRIQCSKCDHDNYYELLHEPKKESGEEK